MEILLPIFGALLLFGWGYAAGLESGREKGREEERERWGSPLRG